MLQMSKDSCEESLVFRVTAHDQGQRLDKVLAQLMPNYSRARLQKWIQAEAVLVNQHIAQVRQIVYTDDVIEVTPQLSDEEMAYEPENIDLAIVAQSAQYIVINKPVGLVTHPAAGNWGGTLLNALLYHFPDLKQVPRAGIVHRLDKDTSGLLVVARTIDAQTHLVRQLQAKTVGRRYIALVHGSTLPEGTIHQAIGRDPQQPTRMSCERPIAPKEAVTHYQRLREGDYERYHISQVECVLETGRTHQIRAHMKWLGHPLLGDQKYGGKLIAGAQRQMLHARYLTFQDPATDLPCAFEAPIPHDMQLVMDQIQWLDHGSAKV